MGVVPPEPVPPDLAAQYAAIRARFVDGLAARGAEIAQARAAGDTAALHAALHRLAGAAGAYGFEALGQCARQAMLACDGQTPPLDASLAAMTQAIDAARAA